MQNLYGTSTGPAQALLARRPAKVAAIALANNIAKDGLGDDANGGATRNPVALACKRDRGRHRRDVKGCEGEQPSNQSRSIPAIRTPDMWPVHCQCGLFDRT